MRSQKLKKLAFINGRIRFPDGSLQIFNILLSKGKVLGIGYLPDEDDDKIETIDITGCIIETDDEISLLSSPSFKVIDKEGATRYSVKDGQLV